MSDAPCDGHVTRSVPVTSILIRKCCVSETRSPKEKKKKCFASNEILSVKGKFQPTIVFKIPMQEKKKTLPE